MKSELKSVALGDVCTLLNGKAYNKPELLSEGKYPVLRVGNFFSNRSWYYSDLELDENKYCDDGDLLYAWSASFGPRIWQGGKVIYHYHIWKVEIDDTKIDKKFLYYWFDWDTEKIKSDQGAGTTMIHVTKGSMEKRKLLLPSLPEQKQIVAILDEAFAGIEQAIANTEKNLASARELFESTLNTIFTQKGEGWEEKKLGDISVINYGYTAKATQEKVGPKFLRITDIQDGNVNWDTVPFCEISSSDHLKHRLIDGDLVFARTGATTGKSYLLSNPPDVVCASYLIRMRIKRGMFTPEFLSLFFQTKKYWDEIAIGISGSAQGGFNASKLAELIIPVPPIEIQKKISEKSLEIFTETKALEDIYQQKIAALNELKQSLLQKAFSGKLSTDADKIAEAAE